MNNMMLGFCDDEKIARDTIPNAVKCIFDEKKVPMQYEVFEHPRDLEERIKTRNFDLLLLDIDMPGIDGISFSAMLREKNISTEIIFVSSREDRVFDTFNKRPFGFIRKSNLLGDIKKVISEFIESRGRDNVTRLAYKIKEGISTFAVSDIIYIESRQKTQIVHLSQNDKKIEIYSSMKELEDDLTTHGFYRAHKSYFINLRSVSTVDPSGVTMENGDQVPLSRGKVKEIKQKCMEFFMPKK